MNSHMNIFSLDNSMLKDCLERILFFVSYQKLLYHVGSDPTCRYVGAVFLCK